MNSINKKITSNELELLRRTQNFEGTNFSLHERPKINILTENLNHIEEEFEQMKISSKKYIDQKPSEEDLPNTYQNIRTTATHTTSKSQSDIEVATVINNYFNINDAIYKANETDFKISENSRKSTHALSVNYRAPSSEINDTSSQLNQAILKLKNSSLDSDEDYIISCLNPEKTNGTDIKQQNIYESNGIEYESNYFNGSSKESPRKFPISSQNDTSKRQEKDRSLSFDHSNQMTLTNHRKSVNNADSQRKISTVNNLDKVKNFDDLFTNISIGQNPKDKATLEHKKIIDIQQKSIDSKNKFLDSPARKSIDFYKNHLNSNPRKSVNLRNKTQDSQTKSIGLLKKNTIEQQDLSLKIINSNNIDLNESSNKSSIQDHEVNEITRLELIKMNENERGSKKLGKKQLENKFFQGNFYISSLRINFINKK